MKKLIFTLLTLALVASGIWAFILQPDSEEGAEFKFAEIARGDIENVVSGTGTLNPVGTVEVGTQVSGTIDHLYADFNDHVAVGQLLAVLDTSALAASVREGEASVARTRAQYNLAVDEYDRHLILAEKGYLSEREMRSLATQVETAKASLQSAEATLLRLQTNFNHAEIRAPIDGTVIQRSVEAGQTVAASLDCGRQSANPHDLYHRRRYGSDGDPRPCRRKRYRPDPRRPRGSLHRSGVFGRRVLRNRSSDPPQTGDDPERGQLHRRRRRAQQSRPAAARDDSHRGLRR